MAVPSVAASQHLEEPLVRLPLEVCPDLDLEDSRIPSLQL